MIYSGGTSEGAMVLIVDDVEINRVILEEIIHNIGCQTALAENGEEALRLVKKVSPQLILSDISMPGMNGYELCSRLKENEETREIPVIFISAFDASEDIVEGFSHGGEDYITKPFIPEEVQARVSVHLKLHEMTSELKAMNRRLQISVNEQLRQMEQEKKNILYALADIAAKNSLYGKEHIRRIKENCRILAQGMQLSPLFEEKFRILILTPWSWRRRSATLEISACRESYYRQRQNCPKRMLLLYRVIPAWEQSFWVIYMAAVITMILSTYLSK